MSSSEASPRAAGLGFWFGVGCPACLYLFIPCPLRRRSRIWVTCVAADCSVCRVLWGFGAAVPRALRGRSGCAGSSRSAEGARRKRQAVPAAKQNNTETCNLSPYLWTLLSPNIYIPWLSAFVSKIQFHLPVFFPALFSEILHQF